MDTIRRLVRDAVPNTAGSMMGSADSGTASSSLSSTLRRALAKNGLADEAPLTIGSFYFASEQDLPPLLQPIPSICRLLALSVALPFIIVCMIDFAGYAIFRTLGFQRRRVRVKRSQQADKLASQDIQAGQTASRGQGDAPPTLVRAPVLQPGSYDADTLLRHRARSISGDSAEAEEEWSRTGGSFARVSHIRAAQEAAAAAAVAAGGAQAGEAAQQAPTSYAEAAARDVSIPGADATKGSVPLSLDLRRHSSASQSPPESPRQAFLNAGNIGVDGALGYFDTDAEDSGTETPASGSESPEENRRRSSLTGGRTAPRRGFKGASLGFTPVTPGGSSISSTSSGRQGNGADVGFDNGTGAAAPSSANSSSGVNSPAGLGIDVSSTTMSR